MSDAKQPHPTLVQAVEVMRERGLEAHDLARMSGLQMRTVTRFLNGEERDTTVVRKVARALGLTPAKVLDGPTHIEAYRENLPCNLRWLAMLLEGMDPKTRDTHRAEVDRETRKVLIGLRQLLVETGSTLHVSIRWPAKDRVKDDYIDD